MKEAHRAADKGCVSYYMRPNPVGGHNLWDDELPAAVGRDRTDRQADLDA